MMKTGPKGFSETEKNILRHQLIQSCVQFWTTYGYSKTSIAKLTADANIATGSFYLLFETKEDLFYAAFMYIQNELAQRAKQITQAQPSSEGFIALNLMLYQEYASKPFLYTFNNHDFSLFLKKLDPQQVESLFSSNYDSFEAALKTCHLTSTISDTFTFDTLNTLLATLKIDHQTTHSQHEIYELLLRATLPHITKEEIQ